MYLEQIKLFNFRNLQNQCVFPSSGTNLIIGKNGQGKTNLIEAVHVLSQARSFRASELKELVSWGQESASVFAKIQSGQQALNFSSSYELGLIITQNGKDAMVNGEKLQLFSDFIGKLITVSFVPGDLSIVKGGPQYRRKFFDRHLVDYEPSLIRHFFTYQKALRHKARLLKDGISNPAQLDAWDRILAEAACQIQRAKLNFINKVMERASSLLHVMAECDGLLDLSLQSNLLPSKGQAVEEMEESTDISFESFLACFERNRTREVAQKSCVTGPHRDDVLITLDSKDTRAFASQGQARSITLVLKLAVIDLLEGEKGLSPVILLDDVESELDKDRSRALLDMVLQHGRQVFISGTQSIKASAENVAALKIFNVSNGVISEQS